MMTQNQINEWNEFLRSNAVQSAEDEASRKYNEKTISWEQYEALRVNLITAQIQKLPAEEKSRIMQLRRLAAQR